MDDASVTAATQRFYDAVARYNPELSFLNYGFVDPAVPASEPQPGDLVASCRRLYDTVLAPFPEVDRLLEVGCGRGGGAAFVLESRPVRRYLGLDLSREHVRMCRGRLRAYAHAGFAVADAVRLPVPAASFDAVFSIEAVHHFESRPRFYDEVAQSLRTGGQFFLASLWRTGEVESADTWAACGFALAEQCDITPNVVASLASTSDLRKRLVESLGLPDRLTPLLMSWVGVRGYDAFEGLRSGSLRYLRYRLVRT